LPLESGSEIGVEGDITEWRLPSAFAYDREGAAHPGVVGTHHDAELRNLQSSEHSACNMAGVDVAGVGDDAAEGANWFLCGSRGEVGANFFA
jgi:hypothetical protein